MSQVSATPDEDVMNVNIDDNEHHSDERIHRPSWYNRTADSDDSDAAINTPTAPATSSAPPRANSSAMATSNSAAALDNPAATTNTPTATTINTPFTLANVPNPPTNIPPMLTQPPQQGAGSTVLLGLARLGAHTAINPITLKAALSSTTTTRPPTTAAAKKPVGHHAYHGRTACDRCHYTQKETCVLQPGNSICDKCGKHGHVCQWTFARTPGGEYHLQRFGRVPLSGPWVDLWLDGITAPSATNGNETIDEDGYDADESDLSEDSDTE